MEVISVIAGGVSIINDISSIIDNFTKNIKDLITEEENRKLQLRLEAGKQNFEIRKLEETFAAQSALARREHEMRLKEQQENFKFLCESEQWKLFLQNWPLLTPPMVIRDCQYLNDGRVCLQVFMNKSKDKRYNKYIYPLVEQGLKDYVDLYGAMGADNLLFYQGNFREGYSGNAINQNLRYALRDLPVLVIDMDVVNDKLYIYTTLWGIGSNEKSQGTAFTLQFDPDGRDTEYFLKLSGEVLACLKMLVGFVYDLYNLSEYDGAPVFVKAMEWEGKKEGAVLYYPQLGRAVELNYTKIYKFALGDSAGKGSLRTTRLHILRLNFVKAVKSFLNEEEISDYLHDSLMAWVSLRSDMTAADFLRRIVGDRGLISKYFSAADMSYFHDLASVFESLGTGNKYPVIRSLVLNADKALVVERGKSIGGNLVIDDTIYQKSKGGRDIPVETHKHWLTIKAREAIQKENYEEAIGLLQELAKICHNQGKEHDAYLVEHNAFLCGQKNIYKKAGISLEAFGGIPNVDLMQETLTKLSDRVFAEKKFDSFVYYKRLNARLCRAQGKEGDAFCLEETAYAYENAAAEIRKKKGVSGKMQEAQMLRELSEEYAKMAGK